MKIRNGQKLNMSYINNKKHLMVTLKSCNKNELLYCHMNNMPIAFARLDKNLIKPYKVFNV